MLQKILKDISFLRNKLENQIAENKPYQEICSTSQELDILILKYHNFKKTYNQNNGCTSR